MNIRQKLQEKTARLGVIGLGYVGLPLAVQYAIRGFDVLGIDINEEKIDSLKKGHSYVGDISDEDLALARKNGSLEVTTDFARLSEVDSINICVPTPLSKTRDPDISYIDAAVEKIAAILHPDQLIILESTTYPGTTEEVILTRLEETGLKVGKDFYLAFSPERVDPGNPQYLTHNIPKVVGGVTPECTEVAMDLYRHTLESVVPVSSARVAETVKLLENTFRSVNIGLVNEMALMCHKMNINVWEVIDAASTKPFGFMPFYPGPGLGGHCIPIDPFYLSWKARASGFEARFIELAGAINSSMPDFVVNLVAKALNRISRPVMGSRILVVGVAYKSDIDDIRESPALDILELLRERGAILSYHDPHVPRLELPWKVAKLPELEEEMLKDFDCAVITTRHRGVDHELLLKHCKTVVDSRNALKGHASDTLFSI